MISITIPKNVIVKLEKLTSLKSKNMIQYQLRRSYTFVWKSVPIKQ